MSSSVYSGSTAISQTQRSLCITKGSYFVNTQYTLDSMSVSMLNQGGAGPSGRASDFGARGPGFEPHGHCVVSLC